MTAILETERLVLQQLRLEDAPFVVELLNEPSFLQYIGDKGVRDAAGARRYLEEGPLASYAAHGFGLWRVDLKADGQPIGMCGLLQRDSLPDPDIGFAFLPRAWGKGYAFEAAAATMEYARGELGIERVVAFTSADNEKSGRLLEKIGLRFEGMIELPGYDGESRLYGGR